MDSNVPKLIPLVPRVQANHQKRQKRKKRLPLFVVYKSYDKYLYDRYSSSDSSDSDDSENPPSVNVVKTARKISNLDDLLKLCDIPLKECLPCNKDDLRNLKKIKPPLMQLQRLIGMESVKNTIIYQVLYFCQNLHQITNPEAVDQDDEGSLMHTVIHGSPGTGKTTLAKIIGQIYLRLGILKSDKFVVAKRKDLIGEYLGQTAPKTTKVLESAKGGVLFIDEAYSLGNKQGKDIYAKECIDTINQYLTEHKHEIAVIIAGYKSDLQSSFFSYNQGLERRFPWVYSIEDYTHRELQQIFIKQVRDSGWQFADDPDKVIPASTFRKYRDYFKFGGGDTEIFLVKCKLAHSMNTFGLPPEQKGKFSARDIKKGLELHIAHKGGQREDDQWLRGYYV